MGLRVWVLHTQTHAYKAVGLAFAPLTNPRVAKLTHIFTLIEKNPSVSDLGYPLSSLAGYGNGGCGGVFKLVLQLVHSLYIRRVRQTMMTMHVTCNPNEIFL